MRFYGRNKIESKLDPNGNCLLIPLYAYPWTDKWEILWNIYGKLNKDLLHPKKYPGFGLDRTPLSLVNDNCLLQSKKKF